MDKYFTLGKLPADFSCLHTEERSFHWLAHHLKSCLLSCGALAEPLRSCAPVCTTGLTRNQAARAIPALANPIHWAVCLFSSFPGTARCRMCLYIIAEHFIFWLNFCRAVENSDASSCSVQIKDWGWTSWKCRICVPSQSVFLPDTCPKCP